MNEFEQKKQDSTEVPEALKVFSTENKAIALAFIKGMQLAKAINAAAAQKTA